MVNMRNTINDMVEMLINLDEIDGELSPADNARIATQKAELKAKIDELIRIDDVADDLADL